MAGGVAKIGEGCIWTRVFLKTVFQDRLRREWVCVMAGGLAFDWSAFRTWLLGEREKRGACVATRFISIQRDIIHVSLIRSYRPAAGRARLDVTFWEKNPALDVIG